MTLKILHYSDRGVKEIEELYSVCDIFVTTGDLRFADLVFLEHIKNKKTAFGVYGNHCSGQYMDQLGIINLHNKVFKHKDLTWGGFQGCIKYKNYGVFFTNEDAKEFRNNFPYVDVLLLHAGPKGMLDDSSDTVHEGSENIRNYVLEKKPKFVFCGHQYSNDFLDLGDTKIYRTYGAQIIQI